MLRAVIDTNHIVSAILSSRGASAKLIDWMTMAEDYFEIVVSHDIWHEYAVVTDWLTPPTRLAEKERILHTIQTQSMWVEPAVRVSVCLDATDNRFLECAIAGRAHYLVTKNIRHFPAKEYKGIKIVRVREFLNVLERLQRNHTKVKQTLHE